MLTFTQPGQMMSRPLTWPPKSVFLQPTIFPIGRTPYSGSFYCLGTLWVLWTYLAASLIVVAVHGRPSIWPVLPSICKLPRHHPAKLNVLATATPLPALTRRALVAAATATDGGWALCTWACHCKGHTSWGNGMDEGWLPGGCGRRRWGLAGPGKDCDRKGGCPWTREEGRTAQRECMVFIAVLFQSYP
jgi:hypothetical protein